MYGPMIIVPLPTIDVAGCSGAVVSTRVFDWLALRHLVIPKSVARDFTIVDFKVDRTSSFHGEGSVPGEVFAGEAEDLGARSPRPGSIIESCQFGTAGSDWSSYFVLGVAPSGAPVVDPGDGSRVELEPDLWRWPQEAGPVPPLVHPIPLDLGTCEPGSLVSVRLTNVCPVAREFSACLFGLPVRPEIKIPDEALRDLVRD